MHRYTNIYTHTPAYTGTKDIYSYPLVSMGDFFLGSLRIPKAVVAQVPYIK